MLEATRLADYRHPSLQALIEKKGWRSLDPYGRIRAIHAHVRDAIRFGYNARDTMKASAVLRTGYGQCNTKATLLLALLRATGIPARLRACEVESAFQKELLPAGLRRLMPKHFLHTQVLCFHGGRFHTLEGFILDRDYLEGVHHIHPNPPSPFKGYAVAARNLVDPPVDFKGGDTAVQSLAIARTLGEYDHPETLHENHAQDLGFLKRFLYAHAVRHIMNRRVDAIRVKKQ